jgi:hypothetical protein
MDLVSRFLAYAAAFEEAYASDDWRHIDPFFTDDAVYAGLGGFGGPIKGRDALKAGFKQMVDAFDKRFASRSVELLEGPLLRDGAVWFRWAATYTLAGAPNLRMVGEETAAFAGDRIRHLEDKMNDEETKNIQMYMVAHGSKLKPAP